jgi:hypothetical protein
MRLKMNGRRILARLGIGIGVLAAAAPALAQGRIPDAPQITDMNPPSAQRGTAVDVLISGQRLAGTAQLICRYSAFPSLIPPTDRGVRAQVTQANDGQVRAKITVPADAPSGLHEIRCVTQQGVTDAGYFFVSEYPQAPEKEPNNFLPNANEVTIPACLAGVVNGGEDQDTYAFTARKGQRLVFEVEGFKRYAPPQNNQQGISYLDSFVLLRDASGRELASDDDSSKLDAFLAYQFPADGKYYVTVRDAIYRGRGDFHYRLTVGERPTITAVFPPGGQRGTRLIATVYGYNLDPSGATMLRQAIPMNPTPGAQEFRVVTAAGASNALPVMSSALEEVAEVEPNDRTQEATAVTLPSVANGKFDTLTDVDAYRFQAQGGQRIVCQVEAGRLGSPVDTFLTLLNRSGQVIGRDDDGGGMPDARLEASIPSTDEYVLFVRNQTRGGKLGPESFYRVALRSLQPGFNVVFRQEGVNNQGQQTMVPVDSVTVQQGATAEFEVQVNRYEGQNGDVTMSLNTPPGFKGIKIEKIVKTPIPGGGANNFRVTVEPAPIVKNGQGTSLLRVTADPDMPVGTHLNLYLRLSGVAGAQPFVVNKPLWLTVAPK